MATLLGGVPHWEITCNGSEAALQDGYRLHAVLSVENRHYFSWGNSKHMSFSAYVKKAILGISLSRGRKITLGGKTYRMKGLFINGLALKGMPDASEPWLDSVYATVLRCREGAFLDVGANIGQTMFKILSFDVSRRYIGFEPQLSCCFLIQHFLESNHIDNYAILPVGLSNKNETVKLFSSGGDYDSTASMVKNFRPESFYTSHRFVCLRKGDELISELQVTHLCAIKIDVEGAELEVIEGLLGVIGTKTPFIIFEVLNYFLAVTGDKLDDEHIRFRAFRIEKMEAMLRHLDYDIFNVLPGNCLKQVARIVPSASADLSITNYIAVSKLDLDSFVSAFPGSVS